MNFQSIAEHVDELAEQDRHMDAVARQIVGSTQDLFDRLHAHVDGLPDRRLVFSTLAIRSAAETIVLQWAKEQLAKASELAEASPDRELEEVPEIGTLDREVRERVSEALSAVAGIGLIAGSIGAIPFIVSFVTVTTGVWIFASSAISLPLLGLGAVGIGIAVLAGGLALDSSRNRMRANLKSRLTRAAARQVLGIGAEPGARCVLSDIQEIAVRSGSSRFGQTR